MLINVTGQRKIIPGIGLFPPVKNYDATEALIRRLVVFNEWQVYQSESGRLITKSNVDSFFSPPVPPSPSGDGVVWTVLD